MEGKGFFVFGLWRRKEMYRKQIPGPTVCNPANLGRKGGRETQIKSGAYLFYFLQLEFSLLSLSYIFLSLIYVGIRVKIIIIIIFFIIIFFHLEVKQRITSFPENILGKFFLFLFSSLLFLSLISFPFSSLNCNQTKC